MGEIPYPYRTRRLSPMAEEHETPETAWEGGGCQVSVGGVAQFGEHLPCKQGVKSSNLSISTCLKAIAGGTH